MKIHILSIFTICLSGCLGQVNSKQNIDVSKTVRKNFLEDARALTPEQAKVLLLAHSANVDMEGMKLDTEIAKEFRLNIDVAYEMYKFSDGWYVFCHGRDANHGNVVRIDKMWRLGKVSYVSRDQIFDAK